MTHSRSNSDVIGTRCTDSTEACTYTDIASKHMLFYSAALRSSVLLLLAAATATTTPSKKRSRKGVRRHSTEEKSREFLFLIHRLFDELDSPVTVALSLRKYVGHTSILVVPCHP